jgi:hypothetical protein
MRHHRQAADNQIPNTRRVQCAYYRLNAPQFHLNCPIPARSAGKLPPLVIGEKFSTGPNPKQNVFPFFTGLPRRAAQLI